MKSLELHTDNPLVRLVEPKIERDAPLGVEWLQGDLGRNTLKLMGVSDENNKPTSLDHEKKRVAEFIEKPDQLNWMIEYEGRVVGSIWVDLEPSDSLPSPAVHIMIGDPNVRGKGIGFSATSKVVDYLKESGHTSVYSRHLVNNEGARNLLDMIGFKDMGKSYFDKDGLEWQNVEKQLD